MRIYMHPSISLLTSLFRLVLVILVASASVYAQTPGYLILGNDNQPGTIWKVDVDTGASTPMYSSNSGDSFVMGMAYDFTSGTLYWNSGAALYSSPFTSADTSLSPAFLGNILLNGDDFVVEGLAFQQGKLYATSKEQMALFEINLSSLVATMLFSYLDPSNVGGIGADVESNLLYAADSAKDQVHLLQATEPFIAAYPDVQPVFEGLAAFQNTVYIVPNRPDNNNQLSIHKINAATGAQIGVLSSPLSPSSLNVGAAFVPLDSDNDIIADSVDNCIGVFNPSQTDSDGDGAGDSCDQCASDVNKITDVDSDSDGVLDCNESCPNDVAKLAPGACGCGFSDDDLDGDGTPACFDGCPLDPAKTEAGFCGCGIADTDLNANNIVDCNQPAEFKAEFVNNLERLLDLLKLLRQKLKNLRALTRSTLTTKEVKNEIRGILTDLRDIKASALSIQSSNEKKADRILKKARRNIKKALRTKQKDEFRKKRRRAVRQVKRLVKIANE